MKRHRNRFHNFICLLTITVLVITLAAVPVVPVKATEESNTEEKSGSSNQLKVLTDEETIPSTITASKSEEKAAQSDNSGDTGTTNEKQAGASSSDPLAATGDAEQANEAGAGSTSTTTTTAGASENTNSSTTESAAASATEAKATAATSQGTAENTSTATAQGTSDSASAATDSGNEQKTQAAKTENTPKTNSEKTVAETVITSEKEASAYANVPEADPVEATVTPTETGQIEGNGEQTETQSYEFDFVLTQEQVDAMLGRPQINLGNGADGNFIISVAKQVDLESIEKGKPSQLEFTVVTEFADPTDKVKLAVTTTEGYDKDYNFVLNNMSSKRNAYVGGYAFIYDKDEYDGDATGKKFRPDHFTGQTERVFDAAKIGTEKQSFPMVCELVLDDNLHAGHWAGVMQFAIKYDRNK
ncbi:MAG: hypothetical protein IJT32_04930 [Lachnospiraceae bacterium]|nr:hypothetical protein [Lachnospiraceae bacterium]